MITLYGSVHSRANRCAWMLKELGVAFDSVPTNFQTGGTREPAFLDMNPNGRVPVLDDDGFYLFESLAINLYLARKFGGSLTPQSAQEEALATQWSIRNESAHIDEPDPQRVLSAASVVVEKDSPGEIFMALGIRFDSVDAITSRV